MNFLIRFCFCLAFYWTFSCSCSLNGIQFSSANPTFSSSTNSNRNSFPIPIPIPLARPPLAARLFHSPVIESVIQSITSRMNQSDTDLINLFTNTFPNPLDTTVYYDIDSIGDPDSFIITGDIDAQWNRDMMNQLSPYIQFSPMDRKLNSMICGAIRRLGNYIIIDPYANSFNKYSNSSLNSNSSRIHQSDIRKPPMIPIIFEGKYELDSLLSYWKLLRLYYQYNHNLNCLFDINSNNKNNNNNNELNLYEISLNSTLIQATINIIHVMKIQQMNSLPPSEEEYLFERDTPVATDTLSQSGAGPMNQRIGLTKSKFRPSDDANTMPFHIPSNCMALVEIPFIIELLMNLSNSAAGDDHNYYSSINTNSIHIIESKQFHHTINELIGDLKQLNFDIENGIKLYGILPNPMNNINNLDNLNNQNNTDNFIFPYEIDGYGGRIYMDDANIPSLLSLPYLGFISNTDPLYLTTRAFIWSKNNPYFFTGSSTTAAVGIGGPHVGINQIWPMSIIMYAMTSVVDEEIIWALNILKSSSVGTGYLHESFDMNNYESYTRPWFAWVNSLFGEFIIQLAKEKPYLIFEKNEKWEFQYNSKE